MKLKDRQQLECYENHFQKKGYDTINCPEYLKRHVQLSLFIHTTNLFFAVEKLHSEEQM